MICSDRTVMARLTLEAMSIGPAASAALSASRGDVRVHSIFSSTANLEVDGTDLLVSLTGPAGAAWPHALALRQELDFSSLPLDIGDHGRLDALRLLLATRGGTVEVDFRTAACPVMRILPEITGLDIGGAFHDAALSLAEHQAASSPDLRIAAILGPGSGRAPGSGMTVGPMGAALCTLARTLFHAARDKALESFSRSAAALIGAGRGLTPAGDDFLCGFLAAARSARPQGVGELAAAASIDHTLCRAIQDGITSTGGISASFLRMAVRGYWPGPLADLALGLAGGDKVGTRGALRRLCAFGHSSGADIATGFLSGLRALLPGSARSRNRLLFGQHQSEPDVFLAV
jgi:hypothetical protein